MLTNNSETTLTTFMDQVWNKGDFSRLSDFIAPQYEIKHDPGDPWDGHSLDNDTFKQRVLFSRNAFPDLNFSIKDMIEEGDKVIAYWVMTGTHQGDLPQLPATGKSFSITGMTIYYFDNEKICGHTQAFDRLGFLSQMGYLG